MDDVQIGLFIRDMRLERGMTQQQLAERLGITDKAVSKWERGVSYPDITLLRALAAALEVSVTELLAGQREAPEQPLPAVEDMVLNTVAYAETARRRNGGWRFWLFVALSTACLVAALVLLILYVVTHGNPYLLIALRSVALGWAVCYPLLRAERRPVGCALAVLSFAIFPFLWTLHPTLHQVRLLLIALLGVIYLWAVYFICLRLLGRRSWRAIGWSLLLGVPLSLCINFLLSVFGVRRDLFGAAVTGLTAGMCFLIDFVLHRPGSSDL